MLALAAVTSGTYSLPPPDPMARYRAMTRAVVPCDHTADADAITVCGRDKTTATQRLPLPDEIVREGPRIPTGEMPSAASAGGTPCTDGCYVGMNVGKAVGLLGKVADHLLTRSDVYGPP